MERQNKSKPISWSPNIYIMAKIFQLIILTAIFSSCAKTQEEFIHTYTSTEGINTAQLIYTPTGADIEDGSNLEVLKFRLQKDKKLIPRVSEALHSIILSDEIGMTSFEDIPAKFINMDATIEVSRNIFQSYFPDEWAAMKGSQFSTLYIQNDNDAAIFYLKTVHTGTNKEIGKYSEDY